MNDKIYVPMKIKELAIILQVSKEETAGSGAGPE